MNIKEYKKKFPNTFLPVKIGKYHYIFSVSPCPIKRKRKFYYSVLAWNIEEKVEAQALDYISLASLVYKTKGESEINKVKNRLKKKILKLQAKGGK